jgi:hypothetical protein
VGATVDEGVAAGSGVALGWTVGGGHGEGDQGIEVVGVGETCGDSAGDGVGAAPDPQATASRASVMATTATRRVRGAPPSRGPDECRSSAMRLLPSS